ncbi:armadillo repeat-containing protein 5 [Myripristis murdjan]|uniref:Armadillo repeat containing 5 n=1 Tax=Myripristis murdjan TaxID=586833 RepID=A0A667XC11_9TELE|nr:armadillo repeat-containing protein 5 [Myripristis murdjan]XP_029913467.1 armadillo repeat-containing protein 5 [Myripristis murdjan]XP_029913468.1 armadillo repeat-containing protein 5 [Myripristis murdjan]XP_029913469.1 armadillo repeat-containing protein 5 [Myripristis murdjan]
MAAAPVQGNWKQARGSTPSREGPPSSSPESSLTWCLSHLSKPGLAAEDRGNGHAESGGGRETDKRSRAAQWRALVAIRTQHIKGGSAGIARFRAQGGLKPLLDLLKHPECSRKILDLALSILANCCTELETRNEVRKLDGITIVVDILRRNVALETVQNRAARALGNLAMDPENSALIHSAGGVPLLLLCVSLSSAASSPTAAPTKAPCPKLECAQSAARTLLYLSDTPSNRLSLLTQGTLSSLAPLIAPEYPQGLRRAALRTLHELTRGCSVECAREVSRSGVLAQLGAMATGESGKPFEELALKTLANMCSQGCLRPLVGSLGVIQKFTEEVKRDPLKSGVFLKALCLCCKEAVNRAKVKESGGLEVLTGFLAAHQSHPLSRLTILACVDFVYDESAMEQLQELGLVPLLVARLVEFTKGEEPSAEKTDVSFISSMSPTELLPSSCFDSFDFPPPEGHRKEEAGREQSLGSSSFQSLRSWLVSEGLISSEGDLLDSSGGVEGDWASLQITPSSSPQTPLPNPDSSLKSPSSLHPVTPSASKSVAPHAPVSSSALHQLSSPSKNADPPPSSAQPSCALTPPVQLSSPSGLSSPTKTPQTPVSPSKFSSPQRKRPRVHSSTRLAKVTLDTPPSAPRVMAYHHPYHPEPWTPESPILLLLSRFSHATDPSAALVNSGIISGLLFYLTQHQDPSSRCFRLLCRLSCNPNCLQALVRTGSVALIRHHLCQGKSGLEREERQMDRVKAKVNQLGLALLSNLRVQSESGFGSGVLAHVMLSGSESDKMNCALSLPLINSNKALLKKLLLDNGGLLLALQPLGCSEDDTEEDHTFECGRLLSDWLNSPHLGLTSQLHSLYFSLLIGCLSSLVGGIKLELDKKHLSPVKKQSVIETGGLPPPLKKPRLADTCPYRDSNFDLLFLLDDGTQVSANREAVAGVEGTDWVGSEYFRALLRGGFDEAQGSAGGAIPIKDVSRGMLLPVLHYLHGCRLTNDTETSEDQFGNNGAATGGHCQLLGSLAHEGLGICQGETEDDFMEELAFEKTPLGEMMTGACRFLVTELQREVEDLCVSLLSCSGRAASRGASAPTGDDAGRSECKMEEECQEVESADESLASQTSELELSGLETEFLPGQVEKPNNPVSSSPHRADSKQPTGSGPVRKASRAFSTASDCKTISCVTPIPKSSCASNSDKSLHPAEVKLRPKNLLTSSAAQDSSSSSKAGAGGWALAALLPQVYWFSQRYSYPALGRACLSVLLGCQDSPGLFPSSSSAGDCLCRLAREADCTETLKRDLLSLVTLALS